MNETLYKKNKHRWRTLLFLFAIVFTGATVHAERNPKDNKSITRLEDFIHNLEKQYKVSFVYDASQLSKEKKINVDQNAAPLEKALSQLPENGISYKIIEDKIILKAQAMTATSKVIRVSGVVKIHTKTGTETTPGVYIREKGAKNGTASGMNGEYSITVGDGATLVFTMIGFKSVEVVVGGRSTINVTLEEDVNALSEVIVTGYQNIDRRKFTGAATTIKASESRREGINDVSRMLEGRVAGVSLQNVSGTFGAAPKIRIRGATSITGDNKPLWVVDNVIIEDVINISNEQLSTGDPNTLIGSSVAGLNPDDIESFQILKDAAATALYGARAMNGVIVITTKRGKIGKPLVSYTANFSSYLKPSYNTFDIMNSHDQMSIYAELDRKGWLNYSDVSRSENGGVFLKMADLITQYNESEGAFGLQNTTEAKKGFLERYASANTDWFDVLFKNSFMQEHSLSVSSGTEKSQLYVSTSYLQDNGWTIGDHVKRFTGNVRADFNVSDKISFGLITQGSIRDQRAPGSVGRVSNAVTGKYDRDFDINPFSYAINTSRTMTPYDENGNLEYFQRNYAPFNIINELDNNTLDLSMIDLKLQGDFSYKIFKGFKYNLLGAVRYAKTDQDHEVRENSNMPMAYRAAGDATIRERNRFLYRDPNNPEAEPVVVLPYGGFYNTNQDNLTSYLLRNSLEWGTTINSLHSIRLLGVQEMRYADRQNKNFDGYGYQFDKGGIPFIDPNIIKKGVENSLSYYGAQKYFDRFLAYMANASYSYDNKYNFSTTLRYDGSNLMGEDRSARWLPTWNVSGSWNVDGEEFMKKQSMINRLTIRSSYGLTANLGNAKNSSLLLKNSISLRPYLTDQESIISIDQLQNSELTWEKQYKFNAGFDIAFFDERLTLTADYYNHQSFDLISPIRTSAIGGQYEKSANYADMKSNGVEVTLGGGIIKKKELDLRTQVTFGYNKGVITNLKNNPQIWDMVTADGGPKEGYPYRGLFSIQFVGLNPADGSPTFINEKGEESNNVYLQSDQTQYLKYEGAIDPTVNGGWFNSIRFKNVSLSALITFSAGNKIRLASAFKSSLYNDQPSYNDLDAMPKAFLNRWMLPGDEAITNVPSILDVTTQYRLQSAYPYNNYNYSTERVADGGFVRMKQVSLSYLLPQKQMSKIGFNNASVSVVGNNLFLIYSDSQLNGQDPEFYGAGGVALPMPRQFTLSLKVGI
ncbi:TonB-dependent receptor [Arcticibacter svalbardensis MN12-7]|uniref:TonB-dependent receptor n=1 Tax=Arcticibacter svalbardensis MN12-7 TaxID=1150600 RepID=R9GUE2_9SPHI|nr:SusC/RagA family TonB-linked outer membrane protein [Arcticibacter svalbardensis]EOR95477.1 TonB-dependent receptor [Arcticibacter svalbardensis MN12-7]